MVQLPSPTPMMRLAWNRISTMQIRMRSGTVVNTMMLKRVRFIYVHGIMIRVWVGLFHEIVMLVKSKSR